ncbi:MAG: hypothetical protein Q4A00_01820 [Flavobacteriaceae bacterium]|nr:hypothetical protein [Flavobacteriaceae bacterium]
MKKIILGVSLLVAGLTSAQKKEIQQAFKAVENGNLSVANTEIIKAEELLGGNFHLLEPSLLEQYYYTKGSSLLKSGKTSEGAEFLAKINELKTIYTGRNSERKRVYFVGKEAADKSGIEGLKPENYTPKTLGKISELVSPILKNSGDEAYKAYQAKNYDKAAKKYLETYNLLKSIGTDDKLYLYYAAFNYTLLGDKTEAIKIYKSLIDSGYTGVSTQYLATDVKTGQVQSFDKNSFELIKKTGSKDYKDLKTEQTPSVELELYETASNLLMEAERYDEALNLVEKGLAKFPKSQRLSQIQGFTYYKSGRISEFISSLKKQLEENPKDKEAWYNLGFLQSQDATTIAEAEKSFNRALEVDPNYTLALQGIVYSIYLKDDEKRVDEIRALQKAGKISEMNKKMESRRGGFRKALPYLEKWYAIEPTNIEVISTLKGVYLSLDKEDKYNEFKKLEDALKK